MNCFQTKMSAWWGWRQSSSHRWCFLPVRVCILSLCSCFAIIYLRLRTGKNPCKLNFPQLAMHTPIFSVDSWQTANGSTGQPSDSSRLLTCLYPSCFFYYYHQTVSASGVIATVDLWKHLSSLPLLYHCPYPRLIVTVWTQAFSSVGLCVVLLLKEEHSSSAGSLEHILRFCLKRYSGLSYTHTDCSTALLRY